MHSSRTVAYISITVCPLNRYAATNAANSLNAHAPMADFAAGCTTIIALMLFIMPHVGTICVYLYCR